MAPLPRYRLYDEPRTYATIARELLTGRWKSGSACEELEKSLASLGAPHAVAMPRARVT